MDVKTGTVIIGVYQIFAIFAIVTKTSLYACWWLYAATVFPVINLFFFYKWTKKDNVKNRERFYVSLLLCFIAYLVYYLTMVILSFGFDIHEDDCQDGHFYGWMYSMECTDAGLSVGLIVEAVVLIINTYFVCIARQNWINLRDGHGNVQQSNDHDLFMQ
jgi:hypothetical protein